MLVKAPVLQQALGTMPKIPKQERRKMRITLNTIRLRNVSHTVQRLIKPIENPQIGKGMTRVIPDQVNLLMNVLRLIEREIAVRNE